MATKIRLQRKGRKDYPFYHIVAADSRAPRDGKFIEKLGTYNPNTEPATVTLNFDRALYWLNVGAQPTDTARTILSNEGVMLKKHLLGGVRKGAFDEIEAEKKFAAWKSDKENGLAAFNNEKAAKERAAEKARLDAEKAANKAKAEAVAQKKAEANVAEAEEEAVATAEEAPVSEEATTAPEVEETETPEATAE